MQLAQKRGRESRQVCGGPDGMRAGKQPAFAITWGGHRASLRSQGGRVTQLVSEMKVVLSS